MIEAPADRFYPGKAVRLVDANQPYYEMDDAFHGRMEVAEVDETGVFCRIPDGQGKWFARKGLETWLPPKEDSMEPPALRYNEGKPESDYIFTYAGGVRAAFSTGHDYFSTLEALAGLYQCPDVDEGVCHWYVLDCLCMDALTTGDSIVGLIAKTNTLGAAKYEQGNYLKGANWRQYFQCAARHAEKIGNGEEYDDEGFPHRGNFFFNVLMICHCVSLGIGTDDRVRAPK